MANATAIPIPSSAPNVVPCACKYCYNETHVEITGMGKQRKVDQYLTVDPGTNRVFMKVMFNITVFRANNVHMSLQTDPWSGFKTWRRRSVLISAECNKAAYFRMRTFPASSVSAGKPNPSATCKIRARKVSRYFEGRGVSKLPLLKRADQAKYHNIIYFQTLCTSAGSCASNCTECSLRPSA